MEKNNIKNDNDAVFHEYNKLFDFYTIQDNKIYCYDIKSAYYNVFLKIFKDNKKIIEKFDELVKILKNKNKNKSEKEIRNILLGLLFRESKSFLYKGRKITDIFKIPNKTALWNRIQNEVYNAIKQFLKTYPDLDKYYLMFWTDSIYLSKKLEQDEIKIDDYLVLFFKEEKKFKLRDVNSFYLNNLLIRANNYELYNTYYQSQLFKPNLSSKRNYTDDDLRLLIPE